MLAAVLDTEVVLDRLVVPEVELLAGRRPRRLQIVDSGLLCESRLFVSS